MNSTSFVPKMGNHAEPKWRWRKACLRVVAPSLPRLSFGKAKFRRGKQEALHYYMNSPKSQTTDIQQDVSIDYFNLLD